MPKNLDDRFNEAVTLANSISQDSLPQDVQLRLYAFYKQATANTIALKTSTAFHLRDAFKTNAWMQISHISAEEAKEHYVEMILAIVNNKQSYQ